MALFKYRAKDASGSYTNAIIEANNQSEAIAEIRRQGLYPLEISETKALPLQNIKFKEIFHGKVGLSQLIMMCRQMYSLSKAGVPIVNAIVGLADSTDHYGLKQSLLKLNRDLVSGKSLHQSMLEQPKIYNSLFVALINVGENTGRLENSFAQLAEYFTLESETRKRISSAMRYPTIVIIFIAAAMVILNIWVIPVFSSMFAKFGVDLPIITRFLIATSNFFVNYWMYMAGVVILLPILIPYALRKPKIRYYFDKYKLKMPIVGSIINRSLLGRFCRSFALMLRSGVPLNLALTLVADAIDNKCLEGAVLEMRKQIEQGKSLATVASQSKIFSPLVLQMFAVGDETGRVDELLIEAADYYEREVDYDLKSLTAKIEPILLVIVAIMVGVLALGIFTPMWDMYGAMQGK
ncbi:MAG: type II secretion system F family protein [Succinivibrionaceae bacterium]|nr:type II secretion system F family protein [Succinivibrionaceae bacterium]